MSEELEIEQILKFFTIVRKVELRDFIENLIADDRYTPPQKIETIIKMGEIIDKILSRAQEKAKSGIISKEDIFTSAEELGYFKFDFFTEEVEKFITDGIKWLISKAYHDGGWNLEQPEHPEKTSKPWDTAYTLLALHKTKHITSRAIDPSLIKEKIVSGTRWLKHNRTGIGWGYFPGSAVNVYETSLAVCCLSELGEKDSTEVRRAIELLRGYQESDGGWSACPEEISETGATSFTVVALLKSGESRESRTVKAGINWLLSNQNDDGGWGEWQGRKSIISKTCDAVNVLLESGISFSEEIIQSGVKWLTKNQRTVGEEGLIGWGWRKDYPRFIDYLNTAMAVEILLKTREDSLYLHLLGSSSIRWLLNLKQSILDTGRGVIPRVILSLNEYLSKLKERKIYPVNK